MSKFTEIKFNFFYIVFDMKFIKDLILETLYEIEKPIRALFEILYFGLSIK